MLTHNIHDEKISSLMEETNSLTEVVSYVKLLVFFCVFLLSNIVVNMLYLCFLLRNQMIPVKVPAASTAAIVTPTRKPELSDLLENLCVVSEYI